MKFLLLLTLYPFVSIYVRWKYPSIWQLKKHLFINLKTEFEIQSNKKKLGVILLLQYYERYIRKEGSWIGFSADFKGTPYFPHGPKGVFIAHHSIIGKNAIIFQQVTIGSNTLSDSKKFGTPTIGDNVYIGAGAKIIGKIRIGNNCRIGANAVVVENMPDNSVAVASPTRIIKKENLDNRFFIIKNDKRRYYNDGSWLEEK